MLVNKWVCHTISDFGNDVLDKLIFYTKLYYNT